MKQIVLWLCYRCRVIVASGPESEPPTHCEGAACLSVSATYTAAGEVVFYTNH